MRGFIQATASAILIGLSGNAIAQGPVGVWLDEDKNGHIEIYNCADARTVSDGALLEWMCAKTPSSTGRLCGRVKFINDKGKAELKKRGRSVANVLSMPVLCISPSDGGGLWRGGVYSVYLDKRANAYVTPRGAGQLHVKGCKVLNTRFTCAEDVWTRVP